MAKEKIVARARTQYTDYMVKEPMELMEFLAAKMPDASRTKLKSLLSKRIVYVDRVITTQYNFPLKPGMKVQISREKGKKDFNHKLIKIVYEDAYIIVIEKNARIVVRQYGKAEGAYGLYDTERIRAAFGKTASSLHCPPFGP